MEEEKESKQKRNPFIGNLILNNENILKVDYENATPVFSFWKYQDLADFTRIVLQNSVFPPVMVDAVNELHELFTKESVDGSCNTLEHEKFL